MEGLNVSDNLKIGRVEQEDILEDFKCFVERKEEPLEGDDYKEVTELGDPLKGTDESLAKDYLQDCPSSSNMLEKKSEFGSSKISVNGKRKRELSESEEYSSGSEDDFYNTLGLRKDLTAWGNEPINMRSFKFEGENKILAKIPGKGKPCDWFFLLLNEQILKPIVDETNKRAEKIISDPEFNKNNRLTKWKPLSLDELKTFIGILYHVGTVKMTHLENYWSTDEMFEQSFVSSRMSRIRFFHVLKCLSFPSRGTGSDRDQVQELIRWFNETMDNVYYPDKDLVLDEGISLPKGRRQLDNLYIKDGFKLYSLSESFGPVLKFITRFRSERKDKRGVVRDLLSGKQKGHSVVVNMTSFGIDLAQEFLRMSTHCTGYLRPESKDIPRELRYTFITKYGTMAKYADGIMMGKWKYTFPESFYISTEFGNEIAPVPKGPIKGTNFCGNRMRHKLPLPMVKIAITKTAPGGDETDPLIDFYPLFNQRNLSGSKRLFVHMLQVIMLNACKLYNMTQKHSAREFLDIRDFRIVVIGKMMEKKRLGYSRKGPLRARKVMPLAAEVDEECEGEHVLKKMSPVDESGKSARRRCKQCLIDGSKEKKTLFYCPKCPDRVHLCSNKCFKKFHRTNIDM